MKQYKSKIEDMGKDFQYDLFKERLRKNLEELSESIEKKITKENYIMGIEDNLEQMRKEYHTCNYILALEEDMFDDYTMSFLQSEINYVLSFLCKVDKEKHPIVEMIEDEETKKLLLNYGVNAGTWNYLTGEMDRYEVSENTFSMNLDDLRVQIYQNFKIQVLSAEKLLEQYDKYDIDNVSFIKRYYGLCKQNGLAFTEEGKPYLVNRNTTKTITNGYLYDKYYADGMELKINPNL